MQLITDGSVLAYAKCGGWAYLLQDGSYEESASGSCPSSDPNIMELCAIIKGLLAIGLPSKVTVFTDSCYVIQGVQKHRHRSMPLWKDLYNLLQIHEVNFIKVKTDPRHTRMHHLAREAVFNAAKRQVKMVS